MLGTRLNGAHLIGINPLGGNMFGKKTDKPSSENQKTQRPPDQRQTLVNLTHHVLYAHR